MSSGMRSVAEVKATDLVLDVDDVIEFDDVWMIQQLHRFQFTR